MKGKLFKSLSKDFTIRAESDNFGLVLRFCAYRIQISKDNYPDKSKLFAVTKVMVEDVSEGDIVPASFRMTRMQGQLLMNDMWDCGVRPEGKLVSKEYLAGLKSVIDKTQKSVEVQKELIETLSKKK